MIRLNTDQMRQRLNESYNLIYEIESRQEQNKKGQLNETGTKDSQVGNG